MPGNTHFGRHYHGVTTAAAAAAATTTTTTVLLLIGMIEVANDKKDSTYVHKYSVIQAIHLCCSIRKVLILFSYILFLFFNFL